MTLLVIEDEPLVLGVVRAILQMHSYIVLGAETAEAAFRYSIDLQVRLDLVIVDRLLHDSSGIDVAFQIRASRPDVAVIVTSGVPTDYWNAKDVRTLESIRKSRYSFLQKPFTSTTLRCC